MRSKLFSGLFFVFVLMVAVIVLSYTTLSNMRKMEDRLYQDEFGSALDLRDIRTSQNVVLADLLGALLTENPPVRNALIRDTRMRAKSADERLALISQKLKSDPLLYPALRKFIEIRAAYVKTRNIKVIPLIRAGKTGDAKKIVFGPLREQNIEMQRLADELVAGIETRLAEHLDKAQKESIRLLKLFVALGLTALGISIMTALFMNKVITEREAATEKLRAASDYSRSLIEASLDPLVTISPGGKITDVNEATVRIAGVVREQLIGTDFSDYFTEPEIARAGYEQAFREGMVKDYALKIRCSDGKTTPVLYNASVYHDESGKIVGVFAAARDMTERERAVDALRESEDKFHYFFDHSVVGKSVTLPSGEVNVNRAFSVMLGYTADEFHGLRWQDITHPDDIELTQRALDPLMSGGQDTARFMKRYIHKNGSVVWADVSTVLRRNADGMSLYFMTSVLDITERKKIEEELHNANRYNRSLIEASLDPLVTIGTNGKITDVNTSTEQVTGRKRSDLIGTDFSDYFTEPDKARTGYEQAFREGMVRDYALELLRADGHITPVLYNAAVYRDDSGKVSGVFAAARDITERKQVEKKLKKTARALKAVSECNQSLVRAEQEDVLLHDVCKHIVDLGGYRLAWVGYAEQNEIKSVRPVAQAGYEAGYLDSIRITWADDELGRGPTGTAIRTRKTCCARNILTDPNFAPWREQAIKRGYQSSLVSPLIMEDSVIGVLNIYAPEPDAFDDEETQLLTELSGDLAFGIKTLRAREELKKYQGHLQELVDARTTELAKANEQLIREIDERKCAENAVRASEERFRAAADGSMDAFFLFEAIRDDQKRVADFAFVDMNAQGEKLIGMQKEKVIGQKLCELMPINRSGGFFEKYARVLETGVPLDEEFSISSPDVKADWIHHQVVPLVNGVAITSRNVTERKQAEDKIKKLNETLKGNVANLEAANKELEAFSYSVSHDLRAPLRAIDGYSRILEEDYAQKIDAEGNRLLGVVRSETRKMGQLIDDLLSFSRIGRRELNRSELDMNALACSVCEELKLATPDRNMELRVGPLPPVMGDSAMVRQVLINLVSNAMKFTRSRETAVIEITGRKDNGEIIYAVKDNGVGFDMKYAHKLFGVFQRLHSAEEFEGTGVGLAIVQRIILRQGGRVWAESVKGEGAAFYFTLPKSG